MMALGAIFAGGAKHGPLPGLMLLLTLVTGMVDAISYLALGPVFVAQMTGNVLVLGFSMAPGSQFSTARSLVAIAAFLVGALAMGRAQARLGPHRGRQLAAAGLTEFVLVAAALAVAILHPEPAQGVPRYVEIALLAVTMGSQSAMARRLAVADFTTTVLTMTLTGLAADPMLAAPDRRRMARRIVSALGIFLGAAIGAVALWRWGLRVALAAPLLLLAAVAAMAVRLAASKAEWTGPAAGPPVPGG